MPAIKSRDPRKPGIVDAIKAAVPQCSRVTNVREARGVVTADVLRHGRCPNTGHSYFELIGVASATTAGEGWRVAFRKAHGVAL